MINMFKDRKKNEINDKDFLSKVKVASLLIHAAKIDEIYTDEEREIIKKTLIKLGAENLEIDKIISEAIISEKNSNQMLSFTNIIKQNSLDIKKNIIEHLWKVIISDNTIDQYESNLMRRICGLIYFPDKECAEIKLRLINSK